MALQKSEGIALFTDGSAHMKNRVGGWAWLAIDAFDNQLTGTGYADDTTNNRMEMVAWIEGLNTMFKVLGPCDILIYSDSKYVGLGAFNKARNRRKNKDLWFRIDEAVDQHSYAEFCWIKGHGDSHYNDIVDRLAGQTRRDYLDARSYSETLPQMR